MCEKPTLSGIGLAVLCLLASAVLPSPGAGSGFRSHKADSSIKFNVKASVIKRVLSTSGTRL